MVEVNLLVNACISLYEKLPKTCKPYVNNWTVISCIVAVFNNTHVKVISLGTGSKCIGKSSMSFNGNVLNDSHAEVIARRAFKKYLFKEIIQLSCKNQSEILYKTEKNNFFIKDSVKFYFLTSMSPCGDASIIPKTQYDTSSEINELIGMCLEKQKPEAEFHQSKRRNSDENLDCSKKIKLKCLTTGGDIHRTGAKCLPHSAVQDPHLPGLLYHSIGAVRTKPGRGDPTLSLSCSDKIAKWNAVGWQGALLSLFIKNPLFVEAIICGGGCPFSKEAFDRAVNKRIKREYFIPVLQSNINFPDLRMEGKTPHPSSIIWCCSDEQKIEVSVNGRKLGVTKKTLNKKSSRVSICKKEFFILFQKACDSLTNKSEYLRDEIGILDNETIEDLTYAQLKSKSVNYYAKWNNVKEKCFKIWSKKPSNLLNFTLKEDN